MDIGLVLFEHEDMILHLIIWIYETYFKFNKHSRTRWRSVYHVKRSKHTPTYRKCFEEKSNQLSQSFFRLPHDEKVWKKFVDSQNGIHEHGDFWNGTNSTRALFILSLRVWAYIHVLRSLKKRFVNARNGMYIGIWRRRREWWNIFEKGKFYSIICTTICRENECWIFENVLGVIYACRYLFDGTKRLIMFLQMYLIYFQLTITNSRKYKTQRWWYLSSKNQKRRN